jgi:hypothetical protein
MNHSQTRLVTIALLMTNVTPALAADPLAHLAIIQSDKDAIAVAPALLRARDHSFPSTNFKEEIIWDNRDDAFWEKCFTAILSDGVWDVKSKPEYAKRYGHVEVRLIAQDGRFLGSEKDVPLR